jgi:hypothetical protein
VTLPRPDLTNQTEVSSKTLYAFSGSNDPFMAGMPSRQTAAEWFSEELWIGLNIQSGAHVRRVHYRAISQETPITIPSGEPFENTDECWDKLLAASKDSRYLGLTPAEDFVDRRSAEPSTFREEESEDPASISQPGGCHRRAVARVAEAEGEATDHPAALSFGNCLREVNHG